jgi:hypothetical protein
MEKSFSMHKNIMADISDPVAFQNACLHNKSRSQGGLNVADLKLIAKARKIPSYNTLTRDELLRILCKKQQAQQKQQKQQAQQKQQVQQKQQHEEDNNASYIKSPLGDSIRSYEPEFNWTDEKGNRYNFSIGGDSSHRDFYIWFDAALAVEAPELATAILEHVTNSEDTFSPPTILACRIFKHLKYREMYHTNDVFVARRNLSKFLKENNITPADWKSERRALDKPLERVQEEKFFWIKA